MKVSIDFGRWTATKAALAVAGALVVAGAVGSALAVSPTVAPAIKWAGGVAQMSAGASPGSSGTLYIVPAGKNFMLTDLVVSNLTGSVGRFGLTGVAPTASCAGGTAAEFFFKLTDIVVPPNSTVVIPFVTGFGFTGGQHVCLWSTQLVSANARGFLFTAAPAG